MLERDMEVAISNCPDLFIESGLKLIRRQAVINGRRPDILLEDGLSRHLLVEVQRGQLDEDHVQRHFYYFFDYRAKYPATHPRLMFIANRIVSQHKEFLGFHGYEYKEYPEQEFEKKIGDCSSRTGVLASVEPQPVVTPGVLPAELHEILYDIATQKMTYCYKMLLLVNMAELADSHGAVPLQRLAERFQEFFVDRSVRGKAEENPNRKPPRLSLRTVSQWEGFIREMPVAHLGEGLVLDQHSDIRWSARVWSLWNEDTKREIRNSAMDRLVEYFNRNVPGGY
jgi:hypothetical protein